MLTVVRDDQRRLVAACDWWLVNDNGAWTPMGSFVYINHFESNRGVNLHRVRRHLVNEIALLVPWATGVYWERSGRVHKRLHAFRREQLYPLRMKEVMV